MKLIKKIWGIFFTYFSLYLLISLIHGSIYFNQEWLILPRYLEYIVILIYFNRNNPSLDSIFLILRIYLILNLIFVFLQQYGLIGEFSSLGYESPKDLTDDRPTGLTGGPWELSNSCAIIFFALLLDKKQSSLSKYFYSFIAVYLIVATQSRTILVSFILALSIYFYIINIDKKKYFLFVLLLTSIFSLLYLIVFQTNYLKMNLEIYLELLEMFKNFAFNFEGANLETLDGRLWSMAIRMEHWLVFYKQFLHNSFTLFLDLVLHLCIWVISLGYYLVGIFGLIFVIYSIKIFLYIYYFY